MRNIIRRSLVLLAMLAATLWPSPALAETKWRKWNGMQTGEVVVCYGRSGAGTFAVSRQSPKDGPDKWQTWTHCEQNAWGFRGGRWVDWHDRQTGDLLWCYGGVKIRPIEGAKNKYASWAKCTGRNMGKVG